MKRIALGVLCAALAAPLPAAKFGGVEVPAPLSPRPVVETHWGTPVEDPYRYFEDTKDAGVQSWMKAQADATDAILARIPGREALLARIREIESQASGNASRTVRTAGGRYFYEKRDPQDNQFRLVWRESANGPDRLILDPEQLSRKTGRPHAIMDFAPSPDGRRVAYAVQAGGGEIGTLHVVDLASGKELMPPIDRIRYAGVAWLDDGSGFFYSRLREGYDRLPAEQRFNDHAAHFVSLAAPAADRRVFSASLNADLGLPRYAQGHVFQIPGTKLAGVAVSLGVERYLLYYLGDLEDAKRGEAKWRQVVTKDDQVSSAWPAGGWLYLRTSKGAPRFQVLRVPLAKPDLAKAEVVVPPSRSVVATIRAAKDALYVVRRDGVAHSLWRRAHAPGAALERVALPFEGSAWITDGWPDRDGVVLTLSGWTSAAKPYAYDAKSGLQPLPLVAPGAFDAPDDIVAREVRVTSHDGVEVPMSILARRDAKLDGSSPAILYGYGAYGLTDNPSFTPRIHAWLSRGGVYAIAHVRGGGAFGEEWHHAGRKTTKPNTWKDAIACAEWLVANGYTAKSRMGIFGGSAGGIFVGRAITERPDLFAAAVPAVGVLDGPRAETSANGVANIPEFGTVKDEAEFRALMAMSTLHAVKDGTAYPGLLLVHGVNDIRVDVWQTLKAGARFAEATSSGKPVLMRLEYDSGHGQGSTRDQQQRRIADIWSFMLWQFGDPAFQPKEPM
ncbi:MAG: prolyl oligopeptidase family serine peptidase [Betaproteobacteria bacterium]|nr:prolyl oligopeptidase family serine peptidase [Betaproteobacteria bacterium]